MAYTREDYEMMAQFEKEYRYLRLDREEKSRWVKGNIYQDGHANELFLAYRKGYALRRCIDNLERAS